MMDTQAQDNVRKPTSAPLRYIWSAVKIVGGLIGAAGAVLAFYQWFVSIDSIPTVNLEVVDNQCLTKVSDVDGLTSCFLYKGRQVRNLWVSKIRFVNDSRKNIIGLNGHDLMSSNICFSVSRGFEMMAADLENSDFDVKVCCRTNLFSLAFEKWRPNQACVVKIYSENVLGEGASDGPQFATTFDPFTQGEINVLGYHVKSPSCNIIQRLPGWISVIMTGIGLCVFGAIFILCLWGLIIKIGWWRMCRCLYWNKKYLAEVKKLIATQTSSEDKNSQSIDKMTAEFWDNNNIPRPPKSSPFVKGSNVDWSELMPWVIIIFVFSILSIISLCALIRY